MALTDKYLFNNTAIGLVGILSTMQQCEQMDLANCLLINPFLLHTETLKFLITRNVKLRGMEEFLGKFPRTFVSFPERYQSLITMSVNCLVMGMEADFLSLEDHFIYPTSKLKEYRFPQARHLGVRATSILRASKKLAHLLQGESATLYLNLRIEL